MVGVQLVGRRDGRIACHDMHGNRFCAQQRIERCVGGVHHGNRFALRPAVADFNPVAFATGEIAFDTNSTHALVRFGAPDNIRSHVNVRNPFAGDLML